MMLLGRAHPFSRCRVHIPRWHPHFLPNLYRDRGLSSNMQSGFASSGASTKVNSPEFGKGLLKTVLLNASIGAVITAAGFFVYEATKAEHRKPNDSVEMHQIETLENQIEESVSYTDEEQYALAEEPSSSRSEEDLHTSHPVSKSTPTVADTNPGSTVRSKVPHEELQTLESHVPAALNADSNLGSSHTLSEPSEDMSVDLGSLHTLSEPNEDMTVDMKSLIEEEDTQEVLSRVEAVTISDPPNVEEGAVTQKNEKLVFDLVEAIHAAEKRQNQLDSHVFSEERRKLEEKYDAELKDARAREVRLDEELDRVRGEAEASIRSVQEKMKSELRQKEDEMSLKMEEAKEMAKAEIAAAIAVEKARQIEKMNDTDLHIGALCLAFCARSEEARHSHSVYKLSSFFLLLENALLNGLPIEEELKMLNSWFKDGERDPLLDSVLTSLPDRARKHGTDTSLQLNQKFNNLKEVVRPLSLIPLNGNGGVLTHGVAHIVSWLKVPSAYDGESGEGIESAIGRVEAYLSCGKLEEAAETLEEAVRGTRAADACSGWLTRVRDRAVAQQALNLLHSYVSLSCLTVDSQNV